MKKYYKVNLYRLKDNFMSWSGGLYRLDLVDKIIVEKRLFKAKEILTGLKIDMVEKIPQDIRTSDLTLNQLISLENYNFSLFIKKSDLVNKNIVNKEEVSEYIDCYDESSFKKIYESMKILGKEEQSEINNKVKNYKNIKR